MIPDFTAKRQPDGSIKVEVKNISRLTFYLHESRTGIDDDIPLGLVPEIVQATPGDQSAQIQWRYIPGIPDFEVIPKNQALEINVIGLNTGGLSISNYQYQIASGSGPFSGWLNLGSTAPLTIDELDNNITYRVRIRAISSFGTGVSSGEDLGKPEAVSTPSAPTITSIDELEEELQVNFDPPTSDGGSAILGYKYQLDGGSLVDVGDVSDDFMISGLDPSEYSVRLLAYNSVGDGSISAAVLATPQAPDDNLLQATEDHIARVEGDGGTILNLGVVDEIIREEEGRLSDIYFLYDRNLGYKASNGVITKLYDAGSNERDCTTFGGDPSIVSTGIEFDGNDRINIPDGGGSVFLNTWSVAIWGRPTKGDGFMGVIGREAPVNGNCYVNTNVGRLFYIDYNTADGANFINLGDIPVDWLNEWNHYVWTGSTAGTVRGYVNGEQVGTGNANRAGHINLERFAAYGNKYWTGILDRMGIYTKILSAQEIEDMYNSSKDRYA